MNWQLIESDEALRELLSRFASSEVVIVDTEFMRRNTFFPQVALLQLCFAGSTDEQTAWLIDPLAIDDPSPIAELLENPAITKVLHSASEDLEVFMRWLGVVPQPLFDTQRAAALVDRGFGLGYRALVQQICDVELPKGETRSDWLQRPLTEAQCEYAGLDVTWLLSVWRELHSQAEQQDKLAWILADGSDAATAAADPGYTDLHKRIKTAWKLSRRQLAALIAVCNWREDTARIKDKPRSWIIDDQACFLLAQHDPSTLEGLETDAQLPAVVVRRYGAELLSLLSAQRNLGESELPSPLPAPLDSLQRKRLKSLKEQGRKIAQTLSVAPEILLGTRDFELLLREQAGELTSVPAHWNGWRDDLALAPLRQFLAVGR